MATEGDKLGIGARATDGRGRSDATDADLALLACTYAETRVREWALAERVLLERARVTAIEMQRVAHSAPALE